MITEAIVRLYIVIPIINNQITCFGYSTAIFLPNTHTLENTYMTFYSTFSPNQM